MNLSWLPRARTHAFMKGLSWRSRLLVFAAIFFTFGTVGFIQDTWDVRYLYPWSYVAVVVLYAGLLAVGYAAAAGRYRVLFPLVFAFHLALPRYVLPALRSAFGSAVTIAPDAHAMAQRLQADGIATIVFITLGYVCFIRFISKEGTRHLQLRTEVALAQRIHSTLVPPIASESARFEVFGRSEPSSEVGGDLLDIVERPAGPVFFVADVSGHGVSAGSVMGMVKSAIRMKLLSSDALDSLLDDLNEVIRQVRSPETFVTIAGLRFDATRVTELALAGHLPILHVRHATGTIESIDNRFPPLGVVQGQRHTSTRVTYEPGDLFALLTDGLTEVTNRKGEQLGARGVEAVIQRHAERPLAEIYAAVLAAAAAHGPRTDDQTLLLVRAR